LGPARVAIGCADLEQLRAHHLREPLGAGENVAQVADTLEQLAVLGDDLVLLQAREPVQAHVEDGLRLRLRQPISPAAQAHFGWPSCGAPMLMPNTVSIGVCAYRLLSTISVTSPRLSSMTTRMPSLSDSSRRPSAAIPSISFSRTSCAMRSMSRALLTW